MIFAETRTVLLREALLSDIENLLADSRFQAAIRDASAKSWPIFEAALPEVSPLRDVRIRGSRSSPDRVIKQCEAMPWAPSSSYAACHFGVFPPRARLDRA
jgi:hypothetical protein